MSTTQPNLPHRGGPCFVTDGGLETDLIFHHGVDLPEFAAFPLIDDGDGRRLLAGYFDAYAQIATMHQAPLLLETPTWRANPDWAARVGYDHEQLRRVNESSVRFLRSLGLGYAENGGVSSLVSGSIGPRGDGYAISDGVDPDRAAEYHQGQVAAFAAAGADLVTGYTLTNPAEAIGIVVAARESGLAVAVSFTVETDGRLPGGLAVTDAIAAVDMAAPPDYFLLNCANPQHMRAGLPTATDLAGRSAWERILGVRVNASLQSHDELDEAEQLDEGDFAQLASATAQLAEQCGAFTILGGCCGTDSRHVATLWREVA